MGPILALLMMVASTVGGETQQAKDEKPPVRHGIDADLKTYPQATPKEVLGAVLKAIENKRIDYLLAHLADPQFVDKRIQDNGGSFDDLLKETTAKLLDDPSAAKQLRRFLDDGEWSINEEKASVRLKDVGDRQVFFRKSGGRWFMENQRRP